MSTDEETMLGEAQPGPATARECPRPQVGSPFVGDSDPGLDSSRDGRLSLHRPDLQRPATEPGAADDWGLRGESPPARQIPERRWRASLLLALLLGVILAVVVHWLGSDREGPPASGAVLSPSLSLPVIRGPEWGTSPTAAETAPGGGALLTALDHQTTEPSPRIDSAVASSATLHDAQHTPGLVATERAAAEALRRDDCPSALHHYRQLLKRTQRDEFAYAEWLLAARCDTPADGGADPGWEGPARAGSFPVPASGESLVNVGFRGVGGRLPTEMTVRVFSGEALSEVLLVSQQVTIALPSVGARARLELECPEGYAADDARRRLPAVLPTQLSVTLSCRKTCPQHLLSVLTVGNGEAEIFSGVRRLGTTHGGVGHFLLEGRSGETVAVEARAGKGVQVIEPARRLIIEELGGFGVETFRLARKPPPPRLKKSKKPTAVPYRL